MYRLLEGYAMKKVPLLLLYLMVMLIQGNVYGEEYSLDDLYRIALEKSEAIQIAEEDLFISKKQKDKAKAVLFPTLSAFGSHTRYTDDQIRGNTIVQPDYTNEWGLRFDQSLSLSGKEFTAFSIAKNGIEKSRYDLEAIKEGYLLNVASSFYTVLKAKKAHEIASANVERLTKHRNAAESRLKVGEATKTVLLRAEAELAGARSELIQSDNHLRLATAILARTAGITGDYNIKAPRNEKDLDAREQELLHILTGDCRLPVLDCLKEKAFSERPEIITASVQKQIAEDTVNYTRGSYWPDIALEGVYYREENDPSTSFGLDERIYGAVKFNFPFFEGGLRVAEVGEAKAQLRQADLNLRDIRHSIGVEVEDAYLNLLTMSAVLDQLQAEVAYASDNYRAVTKQFQYGLANSIDVMDANTVLVTAERERANVEYDYQLALLKVRRATGTFLKTVLSHQESAFREGPGE